MKLLIAEDDLTSRTILKAVASKWGYEVTAVEDGEEAWQVIAADKTILLLLIDWEMPRLDGLGLCQRIREQRVANPPFIILLTSRSETGDVVAGLEAGANDYIVKPFDNAELKARLKVGQRLLELQTDLKAAQDVMAYERSVIENILLKMRDTKPFDQQHLRILDQPVERTSGDVLLSVFRPSGIHHILLGDFTGHGLMAAVSGPIVFDIFYTMTAKDISLQEIAWEINRQLVDKMPTGLFMGAIFIEVSADCQQVCVWNCGMSDILVYRDHQLFQRILSNSLALGIIKQDFEPTATLDVQLGDRIYAYSDGITEVINPEQEEFGQQRLEQTISHLLSKGKEIDYLIQVINQFCQGIKPLDDITLVELGCET